MNAQELRRQAAHYKRVALLVSDQAITEALLELAATYEAMADSLRSLRRLSGRNEARMIDQCGLLADPSSIDDPFF